MRSNAQPGIGLLLWRSPVAAGRVSMVLFGVF